jgi:hypothetical protein
MIKASVAREITNLVLSLNANQYLLKIMRDIAERMVEDSGKTYIYADIPTSDEIVLSEINNKLIDLGYKVDLSIDKDYGCADFTVRW